MLLLNLNLFSIAPFLLSGKISSKDNTVKSPGQCRGNFLLYLLVNYIFIIHNFLLICLLFLNLLFSKKLGKAELQEKIN